jgi:hypothetical protein
MKSVTFLLPFGRSHLVPAGNLPSIVVRASGCAAVGLFCLLSAFRAWSADCVSPPAGLVGWWPGETNANDIAGANNGTLLNGATFALGKVGWAFSLDGTDDVIEVPSSPALSFGANAAMTVELWAYRTTENATVHILGKRVASSMLINYEMVWDPTYGLQFNSGTGVGALTGIQLPMRTWTHLAGTFEAGTYKFYINGQLAAVATGQPLGPTNSVPLEIGAAGGGLFFGGLLDEVSIYNRALTPDEIAAIYAAGSAGKCPVPVITSQPRPQVGYWGKSATFSVRAVGGPPLHYQWLKEGNPIAGATASSLVLTDLELTDAGNYSVVVTNGWGSTTSSNAYLTMNPAGVSLALYSGITIDGVVG